MMKRLFLLLVAAFLVASLGLATPSHAGSVLVTTDVNIIAPAGTSSDEVQITYTNAPALPITLLPATTVAVTGSSISGDTISVFYTPITGNQTLDFTFVAAPPIALNEDHLLGIIGPGPTGLTTNVTTSAVPEPASIALLGIGMTGFLAVRRLFKRISVA